jgi:hypothetical protein
MDGESPVGRTTGREDKETVRHPESKIAAWPLRPVIAAATGITAALSPSPAAAQSIEPRAYSPAPVGTNFAGIAYVKGYGPLESDQAFPASRIDLEVDSLLLGYTRSFNLLGKSAKFDVVVPYAKLSGEATFAGMPIENRVSGIGDPAARLTILFHGAPAMTLEEFGAYRQDLLIGASVQISVPIGKYDRTKLLNLGSNRWSVKPELGISKTWGRWTLETAAGAAFFGANDEFLGAHKRTQKPIYSVQGHLIYNLAPGAWFAVNTSFFTGGENRIDGFSVGSLQRNWRAGVISAFPITRRVSVKMSASKGVSARTGNNLDLYGVALQYRWGEGG